MFPRLREKLDARAVGGDDEDLVPARAVEDHPCPSPSCPSTTSLPSPGSHVKLSSPEPRNATSLPWLPSTLSLSEPPSSWSIPAPPSSESFPDPPSTVSLIADAASPEASTSSLPPSVLTSSVSLRLGVGDVHERRQSVDGRAAVRPGDHDALFGVAAVERDRVCLSVPDGAAEGDREVDVELVDVRGREVVHHGVVRTAERSQVDPLGVVDVHHDVAEVAEEPQPVAVGRGVEVLRPARPVEDERVEASLAFDRVAAVARVPGEAVVAEAQERDVVAAVPVGAVAPGTAAERLHAGSPDEVVVAGLTVERRCLRVREDAVRLVDPESVVPEPRTDDDPVERGAREVVHDDTVRDDLERRRVAGAEAEDDLLRPRGAGDGQRPVPDIASDLAIGSGRLIRCPARAYGKHSDCSQRNEPLPEWVVLHSLPPFRGHPVRVAVSVSRSESSRRDATARLPVRYCRTVRLRRSRKRLLDL